MMNEIVLPKYPSEGLPTSPARAKASVRMIDVDMQNGGKGRARQHGRAVRARRTPRPPAYHSPGTTRELTKARSALELLRYFAAFFGRHRKQLLSSMRQCFSRAMKCHINPRPMCALAC